MTAPRSPAIETGFQGHAPGYQYAAWLAGREPDEDGRIDGAGWGDTEAEARANLIASLFEDVPAEHIRALVEALKAGAARDMRDMASGSVHSPAVQSGIHVGWDRAIAELTRLLDAEAA